MNSLEDTIAAIATPLGEGGIAVIRISGSDALRVADNCFVPGGSARPKPSVAETHTIHYGHVVRRTQVVDEVLLSVMRAPRTFTREDVVEISCHGGLLLAKMVLDTVLENGARPADPGEFTRRAFLNGRIDLAQAEAVSDLIHSRTELAVRAAQEQLAGSLSRRVNVLREQMLTVLAHVEACIDFPDEDIAPDTRQQLATRLAGALSGMDELLRTADEGQLLRRGIRAAIVGRPNAGKSSLLNQLLGRERAIVSPTPGTTRDTVEETANIRGFPVLFIDTAGLRHARDDVEAEGVRRSRASAEGAELLLHVVDGSQDWSSEDETLLTASRDKKKILVRNKVDLPARLTWPSSFELPTAEVSCATGQGIEGLKDSIRDLVWSGGITSEMLQVAINSRHQDALRRARDGAAQALESLTAEATIELVAMDLRLSVNAIGEIVGQTSTEDLLDTIFSTFCIGK